MTTKLALRERVIEMADRAKSIVDKAESEGRALTESEIAEVESLIHSATLAKGMFKGFDAVELDVRIRELLEPVGGQNLLSQWKNAGFEPGGRKASIPFWGRQKTAIYDDSPPNDLEPSRRPGVPLGFDTRHIYELLARVPVDATVTSVEIVRQTSRTLPTSDDMIRNIDSDGTKPEATTQAALFTLALKQVAVVESSVPNVLVQNASFSEFINNDLRLAFERALNWLVADAIVDANPALSSASTFVEAVLVAAESMLSDGYRPSTVVVNPSTWRDYQVLRSDQVYIHNTDPLRGFRFVVASYHGADALVLDPQSVGKLYMSPVTLATFEENAGASNSSTVRMESHAGFAVERLDAVVEVNVA